MTIKSFLVLSELFEIDDKCKCTEVNWFKLRQVQEFIEMSGISIGRSGKHILVKIRDKLHSTTYKIRNLGARVRRYHLVFFVPLSQAKRRASVFPLPTFGSPSSFRSPLFFGDPLLCGSIKFWNVDFILSIFSLPQAKLSIWGKSVVAKTRLVCKTFL